MVSIIASLPAHPSLTENINFVIVGFLFVVAVLAVLSLITIVAGKLIHPFTIKANNPPAGVPSAAPSARATSPKPSDEVPEHVLAIIAAATHVAFDGRPQRIAGVRRVMSGGWAQEGRREIFSSHRIR